LKAIGTALSCRRRCARGVFKPFLRLDDARNQDEGGRGLGLAIARDIARSHGGDIALGDSPQGGLPTAVRVPV
jgi:two-component system osmolarity sensor histidine kinase EnvZ